MYSFCVFPCDVEDSPYQLFFIVGEDGCQNGDDRKKRPRTAFTASQIKALETEFEKNKYLSVSKRMQLSKHLKLTETQVAITRLAPFLGYQTLHSRHHFFD